MHVLMKHTNNSGGMDVWDIVLNTAESLDVLAQVLSFLLGNKMQITLLTRRLMAACEGANKLVAQIRPRRNGVLRQVHESRSDVMLEYQREVISKNLLVTSPGSLHRNGVDAKEL
jgi:hypothetical protein